MAFITLQLPEDLDATTARVLRNILAQIDGVLAKEHNPDGTHADITARSINVEPNQALTTAEPPVIRLYGSDWMFAELVGAAVVTRQPSVYRIYILPTSTGQLAAISDAGTAAFKEGEMLLLLNATGSTQTILHEGIPGSRWSFRLPRGLNYELGSLDTVELFYHGDRWMLMSDAAQSRVPTGAVMMFFAACPTGYTELTSMRDFVPIGGTVAQAGGTLGNASVTPTFSGSGGTTSSDGTHQHFGSTDSNGAHTHGFSGTTDSGGAHTHGFATDNNDVPTNSVEVQAGSGQLVNEVSGAGTHNHEGTTESDGAHTHGYSGTTTSDGAHTHGFTTDEAGAHTHSFTPAGTISEVDVHQPSRRVVFCQKDP